MNSHDSLSPLAGAGFGLTALLLYVVPVPLLANLRVDFVALLVLYIGIYRDLSYPLLWAFVLGLLQDIVSLAPPGQHVLGLVIVSWIIHGIRDRLRLLSVARQFPLILGLLLLLKLQYSWIAALNFDSLPSLEALGSALVTALIWVPLVFVRQHLKVRELV